MDQLIADRDPQELSGWHGTKRRIHRARQYAWLRVARDGGLPSSFVLSSRVTASKSGRIAARWSDHFTCCAGSEDRLAVQQVIE